LRLKSAAWSGGQRAAYETIASGATAGELFFYRAPTNDARLGNASGGDLHEHSEIMCRMVAWLPRKQDALDRTSRPDPSVHPLEGIRIADLRDAIRANRVSFPSQVPTFPKHDRPDLQRKLAQLYFVLGWNCTAIGARYGLAPARVRQILHTWRLRAVQTGYIQHIPPSEAMSGQLDPQEAQVPDLYQDYSVAMPASLQDMDHFPALAGDGLRSLIASG
jgi:hypothetical protein